MSSAYPDITKDLAERLKQRRFELDLTQAEAAQALGVSERTLQNWEGQSATPRARHRRQLRRFLNGECA